MSKIMINLFLNEMTCLYRICLILAGVVISSTINAQPIGDEQINRLLEAVWKQEVNSIDAVVYLHINTPPETEDALRRKHEKILQRAMGSPENLELQRESFNRNVQKNTEKEMQEQKKGRNFKERIRIDGKNERIDSTNILPEMILLKGTPYEEKKPATVITDDTPYETTNIKSGSKNYGIFHKVRKVYIYPRKDSSKDDIRQFSSSLNRLQPFLGVYEGPERPQYLPDPDKMQKIKETGFLGQDASLSILPDPNNPDKNVRIEITIRGKVSLSVIADSKDYSKVYEFAVYNPKIDKLLVRQIFNNYKNGYPYYVQITEYDLAGNMKEQKTYTFEKVDLNPEIAPDVFEFQYPRGYDISDMQDPVRYKKESEEKAAQIQMAQQILGKVDADTEEIKMLLSHPEWQIRIQALHRLKYLLKNDPDELIKIAETMKEDERPEIQKIANDILAKHKRQ